MPETTSLAQAALDFDDHFAHAFGEGELRKWGKLTFAVRFLDVNDLAELQKRYPGAGFSLDTTDIAQMRYFLYLALRKSDPRLTNADIENENWKLTERQVGAMLNLKTFASDETQAFIQYLLIGAGLAETPEEAQSDGKKN